MFDVIVQSESATCCQGIPTKTTYIVPDMCRLTQECSTASAIVQLKTPQIFAPTSRDSCK
ncbi:hypothetical protein E2C01_039752 [Portunus trituberculatus]|uniref:Uncharacterized protein n=1 Tax=Portunus trituberculatus TaxID=210409 RepID=A0A5B7FLJ3_PORTR|nr:hypothetical protein [Portunus trituberculatus]